MAVAYLVEWSGARAEQYQALMQALAGEGRPASGNVCQIARTADFGWRVVDVWESEAAFNTYFANRLDALVRDAGLTPPKTLPWPSFNPPGAARARRRLESALL
jgi:hypothetical protein